MAVNRTSEPRQLHRVALKQHRLCRGYRIAFLYLSNTLYARLLRSGVPILPFPRHPAGQRLPATKLRNARAQEVKKPFVIWNGLHRARCCRFCTTVPAVRVPGRCIVLLPASLHGITVPRPQA